MRIIFSLLVASVAEHAAVVLGELAGLQGLLAGVAGEAVAVVHIVTKPFHFFSKIYILLTCGADPRHSATVVFRGLKMFLFILRLTTVC